MRSFSFPQPKHALASSQGTRRLQHQLAPQHHFAHAKCHRLSADSAMKGRTVVQSQMADQLPSFVAMEAGSRPPTPSQDPIFYTHTLCPYAERVWLALLEKGVPFHLVHIDLSSKPSWYYTLNPSGMVPAVQVGKQVIALTVLLANVGYRMNALFLLHPLSSKNSMQLSDGSLIVRLLTNQGRSWSRPFEDAFIEQGLRAAIFCSGKSGAGRSRMDNER
ncbi:hypothetical protein DUNSADRAFT_2682 [Dunaliella salina]|uniref:GST N-terminal domain-containing protein n=1 Tax=Dunaliella salina TaxID=3046 RepID=A0ABQ7H881_DUNSA|nr:hypothetical protein DUNSADRAFT_2682 [Dunaliella salina]|eukprot:KAF5843069.1 hypothetical protein DUNSADRAFT_2682 [Dunaliella salina]